MFAGKHCPCCKPPMAIVLEPESDNVRPFIPPTYIEHGFEPKDVEGSRLKFEDLTMKLVGNIALYAKVPMFLAEDCYQRAGLVQWVLEAGICAPCIAVAQAISDIDTALIDAEFTTRNGGDRLAKAGIRVRNKMNKLMENHPRKCFGNCLLRLDLG